MDREQPRLVKHPKRNIFQISQIQKDNSIYHYVKSCCTSLYFSRAMGYPILLFQNRNVYHKVSVALELVVGLLVSCDIYFQIMMQLTCIAEWNAKEDSYFGHELTVQFP